jgi:hypothetical protein
MKLNETAPAAQEEKPLPRGVLPFRLSDHQAALLGGERTGAVARVDKAPFLTLQGMDRAMCCEPFMLTLLEREGLRGRNYHEALLDLRQVMRMCAELHR